jgi:hypothetical protein
MGVIDDEGECFGDVAVDVWEERDAEVSDPVLGEEEEEADGEDVL